MLGIGQALFPGGLSLFSNLSRCLLTWQQECSKRRKVKAARRFEALALERTCCHSCVLLVRVTLEAAQPQAGGR